MISNTIPVTNDLRFNFGRFENKAINRKTKIQLSGNSKKSRTFEKMKYIADRTNVEV